MHTFCANLFLFLTAGAFLALPWFSAFGGEGEELTVSGEAAREFLLGMAPPVHRGDWAAFEADGRRTVAKVAEVEGTGSERKLVIDVEDLDGDGKATARERQEVILSEFVREFVAAHDRFAVSERTVTVKGEPITGAAITGFSNGQAKSEYALSAEVPLGEIVRNRHGSAMALIDFGWGDEAFRPEDLRLTFAGAARRVGDALPSPSDGEWCEYVLSGWDLGMIVKHHVTLGKNGRESGGHIVSTYGLDGEGRFHSLYRETVPRTQFPYGLEFFEKTPYYTVAPEIVSVDGEKKTGLSMKFYRRGIFMGRFHFSDDIPFPWLVSAFLPSESEGVVLRLSGHGREESPEIADREAMATVHEAIGEVVDKALAKAAVGDWALYSILDGGTLRYELVDIQGEGDQRRYTDRMETFDPDGKLTNTETKSNSAREIANGFILSADVRSDRFELERGETTIDGKTLPVLSVTGYEEDRPRYRVDISEDVPAAEFVNLFVFDISEEPFYRLMEFGSASAVPETD